MREGGERERGWGREDRGMDMLDELDVSDEACA